MRGLAYNRKKSFLKAKRKRNICKHIYGWEYYDNLHQYSKNKIHCSCPMCSAKTNNKGRYAYFSGSINWSIRDRRQLDEMDYDEEEEIE